ncbi:glucosaminidase domain-containing protein [Allocoleopsis franciscana]|uniref:Muramidase (Flagellum-specific) n=1 Tax=Allocoleopsis franciscana PCC 7113 TaxID=1173027 RepID=K9WHM1_9CYAN|nr:glucosaminidase domain-containing protein [Allocoleopsis franciscana]AFZ19274.1 muramidase (flagellum-specific) [Allocoleopsis franciscana PCC 7113]
MSLLNELVQKYTAVDLEIIFTNVGIEVGKINLINLQILKEVTLAQWLLASDKATEELAIKANNFARLQWRDEMNGFAEPIEINVASQPELVKFCNFKDVDAFIVGYWKFLTRPPYIGLEENTNTPENFLGFLQAKGFSTVPNYVEKVMKLVPEAQGLLVGTDTGKIIVDEFDLLRAPEEVVVGQVFTVEGVAHPKFIGQTLAVGIDDKFFAPGVTVAPDGKWEFPFVFNSAGNRTMTIASGVHTIEIIIKVKDSVPSPPPSAGTATSKHPGKAAIKLSASVGVGGINTKNDIKAVMQRLHELGYTWVGSPGSDRRTRGLDDAIKLFQSIIAGEQRTNKADGRVDVDFFTHQWLQAANAPMWVLMPKSDPAISFVNRELEQTSDKHDFGTHWLAEVILDIARDYHNTHIEANPGAAPFAINDISLPHGGDTPHHSGHETGLMCDVFLPRQDGKFGGIDFTMKAKYDQKATEALLKSIRNQKLVNKKAVFFNDPILIDRGLCRFALGHHHHIHFAISPPPRA